MLYRISRRNQLLELIHSRKTITVNEILEKFNASPATIRKDLAFLQQSGLIERSRGEAHAIQTSTVSTFELRQLSNLERKQAIAREAVKYINDGDTIILDSGTTTIEIARLLGRFTELTVITHSLEICYVLKQLNLKLIVAGGLFDPETSALMGPEAEHFFNGIEANKIFLSASGIRNNNGLTVSSPFECAVKKNALKAAKEVYAVIDSSKFSNVCINLITEFKDVDVLITDDNLNDEAVLKSLEINHVRLILASTKKP